MPEAASFTPQALIFDKSSYSPWIDGRIHEIHSPVRSASTA